MKISRVLAFAGLPVLIAGLISGCSGYGSPRFGGSEEELQPGYEEYIDDQQYVPDEPSEWEIDQAIQESEERAREQLGPESWSCTLSVTYNDDWHDDVVCSNGTESHRPYLREWDDYVEEWEILESASEYEAQLNVGG